ncbi:unnamed protein product [Rotaria sp. Silwood2]|nr:unnamed protein product [Rotaria sp. Silwood2]
MYILTTDVTANLNAFSGSTTAEISNESSDSQRETTETETTTTTTTTTPITTTIITITPTTTTMMTETATCPYPEMVILFNDAHCISRTTYTGIFLTSIILAGISFLLIIALFIFLCCRRSRNSRSSYSNDDELSISNDSDYGKSSIRSTERLTKTANQNMNARKREIQSIPSAPYTTAKPVAKSSTKIQPKDVNQKRIDSHEMVSAPTSKASRNNPRPPASSQPRKTAGQDGRSGKARKSNIDENNILSTDF